MSIISLRIIAEETRDGSTAEQSFPITIIDDTDPDQCSTATLIFDTALIPPLIVYTVGKSKIGWIELQKRPQNHYVADVHFLFTFLVGGLDSFCNLRLEKIENGTILSSWPQY